MAMPEGPVVSCLGTACQADVALGKSSERNLIDAIVGRGTSANTESRDAHRHCYRADTGHTRRRYRLSNHAAHRRAAASYGRRKRQGGSPQQPSPYRRWQAKYHLAVLQASPEALASAAGSPHLPYCKIVVVVIF